MAERKAARLAAGTTGALPFWFDWGHFSSAG